MKVGTIFKNNLGSYEVVVGFDVKGNRKKLITKKFGEWILNKTKLNLENMSASQGLERIMDICGIDQDDKFRIRALINATSRPKKRY